MCVKENLMMTTNEINNKSASSNNDLAGYQVLYDCLFFVATGTLGFAVGILINFPLQGIIIGFSMFFLLKGIIEQIRASKEEKKIIITKEMEKAETIMLETVEIINETFKQHAAILTLPCAQADKAELLLTSNYISKQKIDDAISMVQNIGKQISNEQLRYLYKKNIKYIKFIDEFNTNLTSSINSIECSFSEQMLQYDTAEYQMPTECLLKGP